MQSQPPITAKMLAGLRDQPDALIAIILRQAEAIVVLQKQVETLAAKVAQLEDKLAGGDRGPPPAAPFRRANEQRAADPKRPGRKGGHVGEHRPRPDHIDEFAEVPPDEPRPHFRRRLVDPTALARG